MNRQTKKLLAQLESEDPKERYVAAAELAKLRAIEALPRLDKMASLDSNKNVRDMAYKAVRFLTVLKDQMEDEELRRRVEEDDIDDGTISGWGDLNNILGDNNPDPSSSKIKRMEGYGSVFDDSDDFDDNFEAEDYDNIDLGLYPDLDFDDDEPHEEKKPSAETKSKKQREPKNKENKRSRRSRYRIILWLAAALAVIALGVVANEELNDTTPDDRAETLDNLERWYNELRDTTNTYFVAAVTRAEFDCTAFETDDSFTIPQRPEWAEPDGAFQEGLDDFFSGMEQSEANLTEVERSLAVWCERNEGEAPLPESLSATIRDTLQQTVSTLNTTVLRNLNDAKRDAEG